MKINTRHVHAIEEKLPTKSPNKCAQFNSILGYLAQYLNPHKILACLSGLARPVTTLVAQLSGAMHAIQHIAD
jgi:hypothetical protein